ncbi:17274_t:CDS:2, partial [Funneliformis caledonium]
MSSLKKSRKARNIIDNIFHNYPKLPKFGLAEENLPFQIGKKISMNEYNTFLDRNESSGYKFSWENGDVYIVDMANPEHEAVVSLLQDYFKIPNDGVFIDPPIKVLGQPFHWDPSNNLKKLAADVTIHPNVAYVSRPAVRHPGPPPSDIKGNPHGRIFCEIASAVDTASWIKKCENWMLEQYVRYVFGIKLHDKRRTNDRSMTARLWTRQIPAPLGCIAPTNPALVAAGVSVLEWDFGTLQLNSNQATGCNAPNNHQYQVTIPVSEVFWDPPVAPVTPYVATIPATATVAVNNFVIDLYRIQRE